MLRAELHALYQMGYDQLPAGAVCTARRCSSPLYGVSNTSRLLTDISNRRKEARVKAILSSDLLAVIVYRLQLLLTLHTNSIASVWHLRICWVSGMCV